MATLLELKTRKMELRDKMDEMDEERQTDGGISEDTGLEYGRLIDRLQEGERKLLKRLVWPMLALLLLFSGGCVENTMREAGHVIQAGGRLVTGIGTDWTRAANGYADGK